MMTDGMMGGGVFVMLLWGLFALLLLVFLAVGIVWMIRRMAGPRSNPEQSTTAARQELDVRYARGELTREQYLERRADLKAPEA